jgi:hypothetical protein
VPRGRTISRDFPRRGLGTPLAVTTAFVNHYQSRATRNPGRAGRHILVAALSSIALMAASVSAEAASVSVSWNAPTTSGDGSALSDLSGYRLYFGTSAPACPGSSFFTVASSTRTPAAGDTVSTLITSLVAGTTYFARVTAVDTSGNESPCSGVASDIAQVGFTVAPATSTSFGTLTTGTTTDRTFTVQSTSTVTLTGSIGVGAPFSIVSGTSLSLAPGASKTVTVRFAPTAAGSFASNVNFTAGGDTVSRAVTGSATGASSTPPPTTNPVPVASSLSPSTAVAGSPALTVTVNGSGFVAASVVRWNGASRSTTFVSATQLRATIMAADLAAAATVPVSVFTPTPGGGTSGTLSFTVTSAPASTAPPAPGAPSAVMTDADGSGVTFDVSWSAAKGAKTYRYRAVFSDGTALRQGTITTPYMPLQMPYHSSGLAVGAVLCITSVNATGQASATEACGALPVPARY